MPSSLTPTYTPGITSRYALRALAGSILNWLNAVPPLVLSLLSDWTTSYAARYRSSSTYITYTDLRPCQPGADRLPKLTEIHLSLSRLAWGPYSPAIRCLSPIQTQNQAGFRASSPTMNNLGLSLTHLHPFTGTYISLPGATHALTPLFKGVSARGVKKR